LPYYLGQATYKKTGLRPAFLNGMISNRRYVKEADQSFINYDAYDKDIALVEFYYKKPTIVQMKSQASMSWISYFSVVGGIIAFLIGILIVFVFAWLCLQSVASLNLTE